MYKGRTDVVSWPRQDAVDCCTGLTLPNSE